MYQPPCDLPERGFWFAPTLFTGVSQSHRIAREEIFGPVLSILTFRTPEEASRRRTTPPTGCAPASGPRRARGSSGWRSGCAPASFGRTRSTGSTRPRRSAATRRAASAARAAGTVWSRTSAWSPCRDPRPAPPRAPDGEALHRRAVPAERIGPDVRGRVRRRAVLGARGAGVSQGSPGRGGRGPWRLRGMGREDRVQPRSGPVPRGRDHGGPAERSSRTSSAILARPIRRTR